MPSLSRSFTYAALFLSVTDPLVRAEDVLYSRRALQKRQSDAGNYNICTSERPCLGRTLTSDTDAVRQHSTT